MGKTPDFDKIHTWPAKNRNEIFFVLIILMIIFATFKYVSKGETYIFEIGWADEKIELTNNVVVQDIIIDQKAVWSAYSYSVYFYVENKIEEGYVEATLSQNGSKLGVIKIKPVYLKTGWYTLDKFDYSKLEPGTATIQYKTTGITSPVYLGTRQNIYNIPNCRVNGKESALALVQNYHINYNNKEYKLRIIAYGVFILINLLATYIVLNREDNKKNANFIRLILVVTLFCLTFIYDSSLMLSPTWAEEVTNFMTAGLNKSFKDNILLTDAGYLPLFQRLVALFTIKILNIKAYTSLYVMQLIAYLVTGIILSFFVKIQFKQYFELKNRYLLSLIFMMLVINKESGAFINFIVYGIAIIFFYFLVDSKEWSRPEYILICVFSFLATMSKGTYVTVLPFMLLCLVMFFKNYNRRDIVFSIVCATGALLQLIYYLINGADWVDMNDYSEMDCYYLKLVIQSLIDVPNHLLSIFTDKINIFNGISIFIIFFFWIVVFILFVKEIMKKWILKEKVDKKIQLVFMTLIYVTAQSLFLRITVLGIKTVKVIHDDFWIFDNWGIDGRHQVQIFIVTTMLFVVLTKWGEEKEFQKFKEIAIGIILVCIVLSQPRFQIKGIGNDNYVAERTRFSELDAEIDLFKKYETNDVLIIPIQPNWFGIGWRYVKNADAYCFGNDINYWSVQHMVLDKPWNAQCIASDEPWRGSLVLGNYNINHECEIYQVFIQKQSLIKSSNYQIVLYDTSGNEIYRQYQDNEKYQLITSFTFDKPLSNVGTIVILDGDGNQVYIENSLYVITRAGTQFLME